MLWRAFCICRGRLLHNWPRDQSWSIHSCSRDECAICSWQQCLNPQHLILLLQVNIIFSFPSVFSVQNVSNSIPKVPKVKVSSLPHAQNTAQLIFRGSVLKCLADVRKDAVWTSSSVLVNQLVSEASEHRSENRLHQDCSWAGVCTAYVWQ